MREQSESSCHSREHLRSVPVRDCGSAKRLFGVVGPSIQCSQTACGGSRAIMAAGSGGTLKAPLLILLNYLVFDADGLLSDLQSIKNIALSICSS